MTPSTKALRMLHVAVQTLTYWTQPLTSFAGPGSNCGNVWITRIADGLKRSCDESFLKGSRKALSTYEVNTSSPSRQASIPNSCWLDVVITPHRFRAPLQTPTVVSFVAYKLNVCFAL